MALPNGNMCGILEDSLELHNHANQMFTENDSQDLQKQIDDFTSMMRETTSSISMAEDGTAGVQDMACKKLEKETSSGACKPTEKSSGDGNWEKKFVLEEDRYLTVSKFRSAHRIHIRDFYKDHRGILKPSKRGIALTPKQWSSLKLLIKNVDGILTESHNVQ